jgi:hypothetical protein
MIYCRPPAVEERCAMRGRLTLSIALPVVLSTAVLAAAGFAKAGGLDLRLPEHAQTPPAVPVVTVGPQSSRPAPDLADPLDPMAPTVRQARTVESVVFAKTALDHRFAGRQDVTGSVGFLCGLKPGHNDGGGAAAYGVDPHGRFVGAKLSFAFR